MKRTSKWERSRSRSAWSSSSSRRNCALLGEFLSSVMEPCEMSCFRDWRFFTTVRKIVNKSSLFSTMWVRSSSRACMSHARKYHRNLCEHIIPGNNIWWIDLLNNLLAIIKMRFPISSSKVYFDLFKKLILSNRLQATHARPWSLMWCYRHLCCLWAGSRFVPNTKSRFWSKKNLNFEAKIKILGFWMLAISNFGVSNRNSRGIREMDFDFDFRANFRV